MTLEEKWTTDGAGTCLLKINDNFNKNCKCKIDAYDNFCFEKHAQYLGSIMQLNIKEDRMNYTYYTWKMCIGCNIVVIIQKEE
jgi:hypothetical protein